MWRSVMGFGSLLVASLAALTTAQDAAVFSKVSNDSLLWGPYKPNLYFGLRSRVPKSLLTGLMWGRVEDYTSVQNNVRYTCEQHEGMDGYGWDAYDPRTGGVQTIHDKGNGIDLETSLVKMEGGQWAARIKGTPRDDAEAAYGSQGGSQELKTAIWFTLATEGELSSLELEDASAAGELGVEGDLSFTGQTSDLGEFNIKFVEPETNAHPVHNHPSYDAKPLDHTFVHSIKVPEEGLWQSKALVYSSMKTTIDGFVQEYTEDKMPPPWQTYTIQNKPGHGNFHMIQKVFEGPFEFDVVFTPTGMEAKTRDEVSTAITALGASFAENYLQVHKPQKPFVGERYLELSKSLFSNLIGGIGYFHGDQMIDSSYAPEYEEENEGFWQETEEARGRNQQKLEGPYELFTAVPSRPFFPRGFLWDEGFHLLPILDWDAELTMQILHYWFSLMDEDGWIGREQILGQEARSKVPPEFQVQYPHYANPPTLFMVLENLVEKASKANSASTGMQYVLGSTNKQSGLPQPEAVRTWLKELYPLLQKNFDWYRKTQFGDLKSYDRPAFSSKEGYRWRGRSIRHILTSGLDDYPRAQPPHPGELHIDLISWMGMMSRSMSKIAAFIGEGEDEKKYSKITEAITRNVDDLHWDAEAKTYCDATIDDYEESVHVCHKGYISIFPLMTGLMGPDHPHLKAVLDLIADEDELWSPFGIRSLSKKDEFYGTEENYWRSPVWMPINYLIVASLREIATAVGPHQTQAINMYNGLRKNLVDTVYRSWLETGFAWEQYNPDTGAGQRTQHFTGWTSLIVKIMAMAEVDAKGASKGHDEL